MHSPFLDPNYSSVLPPRVRRTSYHFTTHSFWTHSGEVLQLTSNNTCLCQPVTSLL